MAKILKKITIIARRISLKTRILFKKIFQFIDRKPMVSFFSLLGILLLLIIVGNFLRQPKPVSTSQSEPKKVGIYSIGEYPKVAISAKVEKTGVITIVAQSGGVIGGIHKLEGSTVSRGEWLFSLSTGYAGGTIPTVSRQIAQRNVEFVESTFETQKDMIAKRRDIANKSDTVTDDLREITNRSIEDTKNLVSLNNEILTSLESQITELENTNVGGSNDALILQSKQSKSGVLTGLNALEGSLRNSEYQAASDQEPARLSDLARELTNQQLDIEEKSLHLNREINRLTLKIALISESLMFPSSPVSGVIERIHVHLGESVSPGTILATISGNTTKTNVVGLLPGDLARNISRLDKAKIILGSRSVEMIPRYISTEPTDGALHSILFTLPEEYENETQNGSYISLELPISGPASSGSVPFVPLDAIYQTQSQAYVFIASPSATGTFSVASREVTLGNVLGSYVRVNNGLSMGDQIITDRTVVAGDIVTLQ